MYKKTLFILILLSLVLVLAGCGDKDDADAKTNAAPVAAAAADPAAGDPATGEKLYMTSCVACHGADAKGMPSLGKSLHPSDSEFVRGHTDTELVEFIKVGRQPGESDNTTGVAMPPKGGNPAISDADLYNIVAWIRTLD